MALYQQCAVPYSVQHQIGLAKRRLPLPFMRAAKFQICTAVSAGLLLPLRQIAGCVQAFLIRFLLTYLTYLYFAVSIFSNI